MKCALYRHFDEAGNLLYIGISNSFLQRSVTHGSTSDWYGQIATIKVQWYPDRAAALLAEDNAIRFENPKHNIWRSEKKGPRSRNPETEALRQAVLVEADAKGIKLDRNACLERLEHGLKAAKLDAAV
jgi:excinuclease UvrABC nuclease subunit